MKLFYFIDFWHMKNYGSPITYDRYINLENGPIPSQILNMVNSAVDDPENAILSDTIYITNPIGKMQQINCYNKFTDNEKKYFTQYELKILDRVCKTFGNKDTKYVIDASHKEPPWAKTKELDTIPYTLIFEDGGLEKGEIKLLNKLIS